MDNSKSLTFGLILQARTHPAGGIAYELHAANTGVPQSEVVLWIRTWLEHLESKLKKKIQDSLPAGK